MTELYCHTADCQSTAIPHGALGCENPEVNTVGERLSHALRVRKKTKKWLEEAAGIGVGYVSRVTRGLIAHPRPDLVSLMAEALHVRSTWLHLGEEPMDAPVGIIALREPPSVGYTSDPTSFAAALSEGANRWCTGAVVDVREQALEARSDPGKTHWTTALDRADSALRLARLPLPEGQRATAARLGHSKR